ASLAPVSPRLACVKPVASVHPEPGSNSPLYNGSPPHPLQDTGDICILSRVPLRLFLPAAG
ncbi:hypothetical protein, partial [Segatella asaccharophila]